MSTKTTILCSRQKDLRGGRGRESRWQRVFQKLLEREGEKSFPRKHIAELRERCWAEKSGCRKRRHARLYCKAKTRNRMWFLTKENKNETSRTTFWLSYTRRADSLVSTGRVSGFGVSPGSARHFTAHLAHTARIDSTTDTRRDFSIY